MADIHPTKDDLLFVPMGGSGEIGMNMNLYGHAGKWLMVDLGVSFGDESMPMLDVILPDPTWIAERAEDLCGLVITHAHEDHIGAVQYLWPQLRCPIYVTPFAAKFLHHKLHEAGLVGIAKVIEVPLGGRVKIGPFDVEFVSVTHSIPEPNCLAIRTPLGTVLHTGDWKFDPDPLISEPADYDKLRQLGGEGVLAMVADSTNIFTEGESGSEATVRANLIDLVGQFRGKVAVACFASNVARVESAALAAKANGRHVALVGRSLERMDKIARSLGYLSHIDPFISDHDAGYLPEDEVLYICTGSQGEPRAALARIAGGDHPHVCLGKGDTLLFSSRVIPGNEKAIFRLQNRLAAAGVELITDKTHFIHVSGHPARDEMRQMFQLVRPRMVIPVHGETRHMMEHVNFALECGVPVAKAISNGQVMQLAPEPAPTIIDNVPTGRLGLDGKTNGQYRLLPLDGEQLKVRRRMIFNGAAVVTVVMDRTGKILNDPIITAPGLLDSVLDEEIHDDLVDTIRDAIMDLSATVRRDDSIVHETIRVAARRFLSQLTGRKPVTDVHLVRV